MTGLQIIGQRRQVLENRPADFFAGNFDRELPLDAAQQQKDVQRIDIGFAAEKWHIVGDGQIGAQFQVTAHDVFDALEDVGPAGLDCHGSIAL